PDWSAAYFYRGNALSNQAKYVRAIQDYETAIELGLDWEGLYLNFAEALVAYGNIRDDTESWKRALEVCQKAISLKPNSVELLLGLGQIFAELKKSNEAVTCYQNAIALRPTKAEPYLALGELFAQQDQYEEAFENYCRAIELEPLQAESYFHLGNLHLKLGQYQEALVSHEQALTLKSNWSAAAYFSLGYDLVSHQEHLEGMLLIYEQAFRLKPDWIEGYYEAGNWLYHSGHIEQALEYWQQCVRTQEHLAQKLGYDLQSIRIYASEFTRNIGHIGFLDFHIKFDRLGWRSLGDQAIVWDPPHHKVANRHLLNYWNSYIPILSDIVLPENLQLLLSYSEQRLLTGITPVGEENLFFWTAAMAVQKRWEDEGRAPLLQLSEGDRDRGWHCWRELGVPEDSWFVCLHVREGGFYRQWRNPSSRDANIDTYLLAIQAIVERGGWVIRMGDPSMKPLPPLERVIDYAHSEVKSDWMDVFLWSQSRFSIGTDSGPFLIPSIFGVPTVLTNWVPFGLTPYYGNCIFISKRFWLKSEERYLTFEEMLAHPLGLAESSHIYMKRGIKIVENTQEEILEIVEEMIENLENRSKDSQEDKKLQNRFQFLIKRHNKGYGTNSKIGREFLREAARLGSL
ncbi:MAG: TIGR04372 family glycosyltransferase, partial [Cyanobacteriota bacterium]|nr:TIGR04372 family glycosyltransferase [Cyanobacteriota bacterium]